MRRVHFLLFLLCFSGFLSAQFNNIWYFSTGAGLNFNTSNPTVLTNGNGVSYDQTSTICDASGNLLFYTDGITVWNKLHAVMVNGSGLMGTNTAGQCALI